MVYARLIVRSSAAAHLSGHDPSGLLDPESLDHRLPTAEWTGFLERSEDKEDLARMTIEHQPRTPSGRRQLYQQAGSVPGLPPAAAAGRETEKGKK